MKIPPFRSLFLVGICITFSMSVAFARNELATATDDLTASLQITPSNATVETGKSQQFSATSENRRITAVSWSVNGIRGGNSKLGSISESGLYVAPALVPEGAVVVTCHWKRHPEFFARAKVNIVSDPPDPVTSVTISPTSTSVQVSQTQQFSASVSGNTNTAVNWLVNGLLGGTTTVGAISSTGVYTAPASVPTTVVTVTAQSVAQPSATASAAVTVTAAPTPITVSVSPTSASVQVGLTRQFSATVSGTSNNSVNWLVNGATGGNANFGTISSTGLYTAPANAPSSAVTVTAQSVAQSSATASAAVTVTAAPTPITVSVSPTSASVQVGQTRQFSATVSGTSNNSVNWLVNGAAGGNTSFGTISSTGLYTAPATMPSSAVMLTAQSVAQSTATASATVTVTPTPPPITVSVSPTSTSLQVGQSAQFSATVSGSSNTAVSWSVNGTAGGNGTVGTISSAGLYTAPAAVPSGTVTVTAQSLAQSTATASATVSITAPIITVSISPANPSLQVSQTLQFIASVAGTSNTAVNWLVSNVPGGNTSLGTISASGLYTAPASVPSTAPTVTAQSAANPSVSASTSVTVAAPVAHHVSLSWTASASSSVAGYNIYRGAQTAGPFTKLNSSLDTATVYTDSTVTAGQTYYYTTTAVDSSGESGYSNIVQAVIP